jgi:hypothetical protein
LLIESSLEEPEQRQTRIITGNPHHVLLWLTRAFQHALPCGNSKYRKRLAAVLYHVWRSEMKNINAIVGRGLLSLIVIFAAEAAFASNDKPRSQASMECSKQADAKGLHGKTRKEFRANCKKEFKPKAGN